MAVLVDSSIIIRLERRGQETATLFDAVPDEPLGIAGITASELLIGVHRANTPERRMRRAAYVEEVSARLRLLPFDLEAARVHARLVTALAGSGRIIGPNDLLIAATAIANGYAVLTDNLREFERVPGLSVRRPAW